MSANQCVTSPMRSIASPSAYAPASAQRRSGQTHRGRGELLGQLNNLYRIGAGGALGRASRFPHGHRAGGPAAQARRQGSVGRDLPKPQRVLSRPLDRRSIPRPAILGCGIGEASQNFHHLHNRVGVDAVVEELCISRS
jgi:hypothetical protein